MGFRERLTIFLHVFLPGAGKHLGSDGGGSNAVGVGQNVDVPVHGISPVGVLHVVGAAALRDLAIHTRAGSSGESMV